MEPDDWREVLKLIDVALWAGLLFPEYLPALAVDLLVIGADSQALRELAGADLEPSDPRDFRDAFLALLDEQALPRTDLESRLELAAKLLALAVLSGDLEVREGVHRASRIVIAAGYPDNSDLMGLYGLDDEWGQGWGRPQSVQERDALEMFTRLAHGAPDVPHSLLAAIAQSR